MNSKELFLEALRSSTKAMLLVKPTDYLKHTPDTEWDVKTLANHMLYELSWSADIVLGKTIKEVGTKYDGDLIKDNLQERWFEAEKRAKEAVKSADLKATAHLSWMDATNDYYLKQAASDQLIHSWDLSAALSRPIEFDPDIAEEVYRINLPNKDSMAASSYFKPALDVASSSDIQTKLLALYGRDINWHP